MPNLLYIKASPREHRSRSTTVADVFLEAYLGTHPEATASTLDLFEATLPAFDRIAVEGKYAIIHGTEATPETKTAFGEVVKLVEQFKAADMYLFAVPMWNFGIPYRLKHYLDLIVQPSYTFAVGPSGYRGLLSGKKAVTVYARGGDFSAPEAAAVDFQQRYMEHILRFIGITDVHAITVQPTLASGPDVSKERVTLAKQEAKELASHL